MGHGDGSVLVTQAWGMGAPGFDSQNAHRKDGHSAYAWHWDAETEGPWCSLNQQTPGQSCCKTQGRAEEMPQGTAALERVQIQLPALTQWLTTVRHACGAQ